MPTPPVRVVVVGGGVLGASTASQLARGGAHVTLVTDGEPASGASGRSLSWLNSAGARREDYHRLRTAGLDRYRTLAARRPTGDWLRFDGGLAWFAEGRHDELTARHRAEVDHGYESHRVSRDDVAAVAPGVDPSSVPADGALWNPGEGWVDLPSLVRLLLADLTARGGRLVTGAGPATVEVADGRVGGVRTADGTVHRADAVVLAVGAGTPAALAALGLAVPDATPLALLVTTEPVDTPLRSVLNTPRVALRPGPRGGLAVDSDWTAASIERTPDGYRVPDDVVTELLAEASAVLAGRPRLTAARWGIGAKPIPGDGDPVLGMVDAVDGLSVAFTHSGATLGLIAGELLADEVLTGRPHPMLAPFNLRRFG